MNSTTVEAGKNNEQMSVCATGAPENSVLLCLKAENVALSSKLTAAEIQLNDALEKINSLQKKLENAVAQSGSWRKLYLAQVSK
eukprot:CAMPEP_0177578604 /NCGR_PEP_ID=MMETSP0419_2-20121207/445_1 /TAXON_ID=582737 /ORGANISM="Tetraselmis sp., Strain GSL018" /LENGTH=83 /DNA_ID=CAMNT_0019067075 /DNA_START=760 /DNA_END=1011 /DNA_ORIENTATION=-